VSLNVHVVNTRVSSDNRILDTIPFPSHAFSDKPNIPFPTFCLVHLLPIFFLNGMQKEKIGVNVMGAPPGAKAVNLSDYSYHNLLHRCPKKHDSQGVRLLETQNFKGLSDGNILSRRVSGAFQAR
jgi:hypothetical protein